MGSSWQSQWCPEKASAAVFVAPVTGLNAAGCGVGFIRGWEWEERVPPRIVIECNLKINRTPAGIETRITISGGIVWGMDCLKFDLCSFARM